MPTQQHTQRPRILTSPARRRLLCGVAWAACAALPLMTTGCGDDDLQWHHYNVRSHLPDLQFALIGPGGKPYTEANVLGKTTVLFFGYASCPDVCPTTMAQLTEVLRLLGPDADNVRVLFVSVDPHRDTPKLLQRYVNAFSPNAIGLTGNEKTIARLAKRYRVAYQIEKPRDEAVPGTYDVTHSRGIYVFDDRGRARLLAPDSASAESLAGDLAQLIAHSRANPPR